jgi:trigger factor
VNITAENVSVLENKVIVNIEPADYAAKFDEAVKSYRRKVAMPGFRTGMVPVGMVKKMYGKALLYEELNKLVQDGINQYLEENKLDIFAQPMPEVDNDPFANGMEGEQAYSFTFSIGLKPALELLYPAQTFTKYLVEPAAEMVENYIKDLRSRHFEGAYPETSETGDMVFLRLRELDENGVVKTGGLVTVSLVKLADLADETLQTELTGIGREYSTRTNLNLIFGNDDEKIAAGIKKSVEELAQINREVEATVSNVMREGLADMNEAFFGKVFGNEDIKTEADFTDRIKLELGRSLQAEAERLLRNDIMDAFFQTEHIELPDDFLKRWLLSNAKKPVDSATLEQQYPEYAKQLRRDLLIDKVLEENQVEIEGEEIINEAKGLLYRQFSSYGIPMDDQTLQKYALDYLQKDDNYTNVYYSMKYRKVEEVVREKVAVSESPLSFAEFEKLTQQKAV